MWLCDKSSDQKVKVESPAEWGRRWSWKLTEDGSGICFKGNFAYGCYGSEIPTPNLDKLAGTGCGSPSFTIRPVAVGLQNAWKGW